MPPWTKIVSGDRSSLSFEMKLFPGFSDDLMAGAVIRRQKETC